ncbi:ACT domain-containing protein [Nocardioides anomalus]|uniref:ACT domain-containing protein n=1 Tax=Nocardioides anomalus TaxID=2712223 RepID=A0A6G6WJ51_9ACTN|nr:ACT domain-containing protein [Nocardioides anomalus]QIG45274.1 ACT domain-containing protein [Nocardioides anomalus]
MATFVLTVLGDDRPGLVSALSATITAHGASWERSQLAQLAGKFAGIVVVRVPDDRHDALVAELAALEGLQVATERSERVVTGETSFFLLELLGDDRPGIVAEISSALAEAGVSIEELTTDVREAPHAGGMLFEARALLDVPAGATQDDVQAVLEGLADELMVELRLSEQ